MRRFVLRFVLLSAIAGCGNLTCDQQKKESIKHMNAGVEAFNSAAFAKAEKELELATTLDPQNHRAAYNLGLVYIEQRKWDKASNALEVAVKFNPTDPMYRYHLGHAYLEEGKLDRALAELEEAIKSNPRLYKAHYFLGIVHERQDRPREAAAAWTESARLNPGFGKPFVHLCRLYYTWDYFQEAVTVCEQGAQYAKDAEDRTDIYYYLGMAYDGLKRYDKAIEAYLKAIEERKDNQDARLQVGLAYANKGDKANARKYLEEFVKQGGGGNAFAVQAANQRLMGLIAQ